MYHLLLSCQCSFTCWVIGPPAEGPSGGGRPPRGPVGGGPPAGGPRRGGRPRRGPGGGGRPPRVHRRRRGARGGGARRGAWGSPKRLYKAPTDYTKPRQTIQSPNRLYKAPTDYTKPQRIRQTKTIRAPRGPGSGTPPHYQEYSPNSSILELTPRKLVHSA